MQKQAGDGQAARPESRFKAEARQCIDGLVDAALASDPEFTASHANIVKELVFRTLENDEQGAGLLRIAELTRAVIRQIAGRDCLQDGVDRVLANRPSQGSDPRPRARRKIEPRRRHGAATNPAESYVREVQGLGRLLTKPEMKRYLGLITADGSKLRLTRDRSSPPGELLTYGDLERELLKITRERLLQHIEHLKASLPAALRRDDEKSLDAIANKVRRVDALREVRSLTDTIDRIRTYYANKAQAPHGKPGSLWEDIFSFISG